MDKYTVQQQAFTKQQQTEQDTTLGASQCQRRLQSEMHVKVLDDDLQYCSCF